MAWQDPARFGGSWQACCSSSRAPRGPLSAGESSASYLFIVGEIRRVTLRRPLIAPGVHPLAA